MMPSDLIDLPIGFQIFPPKARASFTSHAVFSFVKVNWP